MPDKLKQHRIIGIRHTLKHFKKAGLIEQEICYPDDAVDSLRAQEASIARRWYRAGARRGALEILEAFLDRKFELRTDKDNKIEIVARTKSVTWERSLDVTVGNKKLKVSKRRYKLNLKELEFDV